MKKSIPVIILFLFFSGTSFGQQITKADLVGGWRSDSTDYPNDFSMIFKDTSTVIIFGEGSGYSESIYTLDTTNNTTLLILNGLKHTPNFKKASPKFSARYAIKFIDRNTFLMQVLDDSLHKKPFILSKKSL